MTSIIRLRKNTKVFISSTPCMRGHHPQVFYYSTGACVCCAYEHAHKKKVVGCDYEGAVVIGLQTERLSSEEAAKQRNELRIRRNLAAMLKEQLEQQRARWGFI